MGAYAPLIRILMKHGLWALVLACTTSVWAVPDWTQADIVKIEQAPVKVGQKVRFTVTETNGHLVVDQMEPAK